MTGGGGIKLLDRACSKVAAREKVKGAGVLGGLIRIVEPEKQPVEVVSVRRPTALRVSFAPEGGVSV